MKRLDLAGQQFGRLLVLGLTTRIGKDVRWRCRCECGVERAVSTSHLRSGHTRSCGCLTAEVTAAKNKAAALHGMWRSPEFEAWHAMIQRCHNQRNRQYASYGGRGIVVCDAWRHDFRAFYSHIGPRPSSSHSIDRIRNNEGYRPGNVRWATAVEQNNNRRSNITAVVDGETLTAAQIARRFGLLHGTVANRIRAGRTGDSLVMPSRRQQRIEAVLAEFDE